jgi:hypothetical protein
MKVHSKIPVNITDTNQLRSMERRRNIVARTISRVFINQSHPLTNTAQDHTGNMSRDHVNLSEPVHNRPHEVEVEDPLKPSIDLRRPPRGIVRWAKMLPGRIKRYYRILFPIPTPEQIENKHWLEEEKYKDKLCIKEARKYGKLASNKLAQLGMRELLNSPDPNKPKRLKQVKWSMITRDALFNKIVLRMDTDPRHLPTYVRVSELGRNPLYSDEMLPTLGKYSQWNSEDWGVGLTIFRHGLEGLPEFVTTADLWKRCPANKPPLTVAVGFGNNSSTHFIDPGEYPHLLVSGGTGWGKSNTINQIICFWLHRGLTPKELQLVLFDLKKGMEFANYENLPHLYQDEVIKTGIVEDLDGVLPTLRRMQEVRDRRMELIKARGCKNFQDYNREVSVDKRLPAIFLVFDEWAKIRLSRSATGPMALVKEVTEIANKTVMDIFKSRDQEDRVKLYDTLVKFGKEILKLRTSKHFGLEAEELLAEFTNLARAAGMYVILSTQHPSKEVLTGLIMINFPTRIVLNSSIGGSMAALATQSAFGLEYKGRAILMDRGQEIKLQTPYISPETIKAIVHKAITGEDAGSFGGVSIEDILKYALENLAGKLDVQKLYGIFRTQKVRQAWLVTTMRESEGKIFTISGHNYRVNPRGKHTPRQLVPIDK